MRFSNRQGGPGRCAFLVAQALVLQVWILNIVPCDACRVFGCPDTDPCDDEWIDEFGNIVKACSTCQNPCGEAQDVEGCLTGEECSAGMDCEDPPCQDGFIPGGLGVCYPGPETETCAGSEKLESDYDLCGYDQRCKCDDELERCVVETEEKWVFVPSGSIMCGTS